MKKILFTILSCFLFIGICNAEITTYDRNILVNYGVNKDIQIEKIDNLILEIKKQFFGKFNSLHKFPPRVFLAFRQTKSSQKIQMPTYILKW